jgi:hypothetical protein
MTSSQFDWNSTPASAFIAADPATRRG